jgi:hypothetical protein
MVVGSKVDMLARRQEKSDRNAGPALADRHVDLVFAFLRTFCVTRTDTCNRYTVTPLLCCFI